MCKRSCFIRIKMNAQNKCDKCGSDTISTCLSCGTPIKGSFIYPSNMIGYHSFNFPNYCYDCGEPYPWTTLILENAIELISLDEGVNSDIKEIIKNSIPDLLLNTPTTPIALAKFKINVEKLSTPIKDGLYQLLIDVASETVKKAIFPS